MKLVSKAFINFSRFKVPYNINFEEHKTYLKKIERSESLLDQTEKSQVVPRRKRRIYDRERIDRDIVGYGAWRVFEEEEMIVKENEHAMEVYKIQISPKWLIHAFGIGHLPISNKRSAHREFYFEDNRLNRYVLYEYRNTTNFKPNDEDYDYENQDNLHPRARIQKRISPEEFWLSEDLFEFRINYTQYAEKFKFEKWLLSEIERKKSLKSFDEHIDEKFGTVLTFNKKEDATRFEALAPMVKNVSPESFAIPKKGKKVEETEGPKFKSASQMDEVYRIKEKICFKEEESGERKESS